MIGLNDISGAFSLWIDTVARTLRAPLERLKPVRQIEIVEEEDGAFTLRLARGARGKGETLPPARVHVAEGTIMEAVPPQWAPVLRDSRIDVVLQPSRFLFRPLELPDRATEFLDGIVRAQIDRLTPWSASDAAYHWTPPREIAGDRIAMTIVATARSAIVSLAQAFAALGVAAVDILTVAPGAEGVRVPVYSQRGGGRAEGQRLRTALRMGFLATGLLAALSIAASPFFIDRYDTQNQQIQRRIAERRAVIRAGQTGAASSALELLQRRKYTTASSVLVIEALSQLLPDHTYASELRIEGDKLQIIGITRDAPSLIPILEQSPHFARAAFFAPTTRAPNDAGERFHIEAKIRPHFGAGT